MGAWSLIRSARHRIVLIDNYVDDTAVSVFAAGGAVVIAGAQDQRVRVVDLTGRTLVNTLPASDYEQIPMGKGLYLVLVGNQTYKVSVR